jgi:lysophospholipase L1-like esterase
MYLQVDTKCKKQPMGNLKVTFILILFATIITGCQQDKPKVLIIGDSISIGYTPFVQENLKNIAYVFHNRGNAKHTDNGLDNIEKWLSDTNWDIIQFNWGLWDLCYRQQTSKKLGKRDKINGKITIDSASYERNLGSIVKLIRKKSNAQLLFVTTTYVPDNAVGRYKEDAIKYNQIAKKIMKSHNIKVNDVYDISREIHLDFGKGVNDVHYTDKGYEQLGLQISDFLKHEIMSLLH